MIHNFLRDLLLFTAVAACFSACKDKSSSNPTPDLDASSQVYFDINADHAGDAGNPADDYVQEAWEPWVRALFAPLDTGSLPASAPLPHADVRIYPNPCFVEQGFVISAFSQDSINLKAVLVNRKREPLLRFNLSLPLNAGTPFFDYRNIDRKGDSLFRIYYAFSSRSNPYYYTAHADVTIKP